MKISTISLYSWQKLIITIKCYHWRIIIIIMFISSNYLSVSGEHRVHFNTNVCSRFCCTPRPFQAYGYPLLLLYLGGLVFILAFRQECVPYAAVYLRLLVLWRYPTGSSFSPHTRHYTDSFRISPCPLCSLLWISGLRHSTEIDSCL